MANCNVDMYTEALTAEAERLNSLLQEGVNEDAVGNKVEETLESINGILKAITNENLKKVQRLADDLTVVGQLRSTFDGGLPVQFNTENASVRYEAIKKATFDGDYLKVTTDRGFYTFAQGSDRSTTFQNGNRFAIVQNIGAFTNSIDVGKMLGSSTESEKLRKNKVFERVEKHIHGNVAAMKELLNELHELGGRKESTEHMEYLQGLFDQFKPEFFTDMTTYITQKSQESLGVITSKAIKLSISNKPKVAHNQQTEAEIYAHEVVHSMTQFALESGDLAARRAAREIEYLMKVAAKEITPEKLLKASLPDGVVATEEEVAIAKELYSYIFEHENAREEFLAHVLTNPAVMSLAKKIKVSSKGVKENQTLFQKIAELFATLMDVVLGRYTFKDKDKSVYDAISRLAMQLGELNNRTLVEAKRQENLVDKFGSLISTADKKISDFTDDVFDKYLKDDSTLEPYPKNGSTRDKAVWSVKFVQKSLVNDTYGKAFGLMLSSWGIKPEGFARSIHSDLTSKESDDVHRAVEWLGLQAERVDAAKMSFINTVTKTFYEGFKERPTKEQEEALTRVVLDTDLSSIYNEKGYSNSEVRKLLEDKDALETKIGRVKHSLREASKTKEDGNWHVNQASGLGYYLATHKAHVAQNFNAANIARGLLSTNYKKPEPIIVNLIDELATLTALKYTPQAKKDMVAKLMKDDFKGVQNVIALHKGFKTESEKSVFEQSKTHMIKGYTKEVFSEDIEMEIAPVSKEAEMKVAGYELKQVLTPHSSQFEPVPMAIYIARYTGKSEYLKSATRLSTLGTKGTTLTSTKYKDGSTFAAKRANLDKLRMDRVRLDLADQMRSGDFNIEEVEYGVAPVVDEHGTVVDYRHMMDKKSKEVFLGQDLSASEILARSIGSTLDKKMSAEHNQRVVDLVLQDMKDNWREGTHLGKDLSEYVLIGPNVTNKEMKELYYLLPDTFKAAINKRQDKVIAVRRDLQHLFFGYRNMSIVDAPIIAEFTPAMIKTLLKIAETLWMELIGIAKTNILMKMPLVLVGNIISNAMYAVATGTSPVELIKLYVESFRDVRSYVNSQREVVQLTVKKNSGKLTAKEQVRLSMLENDMKKNPVHGLMELGMYTAIQEDVDAASLRATNKWKKLLDEKMTTVPSVVKTPLQWLYLSEETQWYKFNQEVLQMSDLIARDAKNRKMKKIEEDQMAGRKELPRWWTMDGKDESEGYVGETRKLNAKERKKFMEMAKEKRHYALLEDFVNYSKPSSRLEEYANKMGIMMFTKYYKRIQKVIQKTLKGNFASAMLLLAGEGFVGDVESIFDQSLVTKNWTDVGPFELPVRVYSPFDHMMNVLTPALVKSETYGGLL